MLLMIYVIIDVVFCEASSLSCFCEVPFNIMHVHAWFVKGFCNLKFHVNASKVYIQFLLVFSHLIPYRSIVEVGSLF